MAARVKVPERPCPVCGSWARECVKGREIYTDAPRGLAKRWFWRCGDCKKSRVGCHPGSRRPLGTLAGPTLRRLRSVVHSEFDVFWKLNFFRRSEAYRLLAEDLGIPVEECHISWFDAEQCERAIQVSRNAFLVLSELSDAVFELPEWGCHG